MNAHGASLMSRKRSAATVNDTSKRVAIARTSSSVAARVHIDRANGVGTTSSDPKSLAWRSMRKREPLAATDSLVQRSA